MVLKPSAHTGQVGQLGEWTMGFGAVQCAVL